MVIHAARDNIVVLAVSRDEQFVASLAEALQGSRELLHAPDMETAENLAIAHKVGVLVTDRGISREEIKAIANRLRPIVPQLVIIVAGDRSHANEMMDLITNGDVYRFLLTPLAHGQTRVCIESAVSRFVALAAAQPTEPVKNEQALPGNRVILFGAAAAALVLAAGIWLFVSSAENSSPPSAADAGSQSETVASPDAASRADAESESRVAAVERSLSLAREALADGRYVQPIGANALYFFRSTLAAEPQNREALTGLNTIAEVLLERTTDALNSGAIDTARSSLAIVRSIRPDHPALPALQQRLGLQDVAAAIANAQQRALAQDFAGALELLAALEDGPDVSAARNAIRQAQQAARVEASLQRMAVLIATDQLIEPADDSAVYHALDAVRLAPESIEVTTAVAGLGDLLVQRASDAAAAGDLTSSEQWLATAESLGVVQEAVDAAREANGSLRAEQDAAAALATRNAQSIALARERISNGQLLEPRGDSALFHVERVRASNPGNPDLAATEALLGEALLASAAERISDGALDEAGGLLNAAADLGMDSTEVQTQRRALESARAQQAAAAQLPAFISTQQLTRTKYVAPTYPAMAQRRGQEGSVLLEFTLATDGTVKDIDIIEAEPRIVFNRAATSALSRWEFEPFVFNGEVTEVRARVDMSFVLN